MVENRVSGIVSLLCLLVAVTTGCASYRNSATSVEESSKVTAVADFAPEGLVTSVENNSVANHKTVETSEPGPRVQFEINLLKACSSSQKDKKLNLVVSPYSAGQALSMLMEGASGETRREIESALAGGTFAGVRPSHSDAITVANANSIWMHQGFSVKESYKSLLQESYQAQLFTKDFSDKSTVGQINAWCSDHTAGKIPSIIDRIGPDMRMFILNALYFNADWQNAFEKQATTKMTFHSPSSDDLVDFMSAERGYSYANVMGNQVISLPYKDWEYDFLVILPSEGISAEDLLSMADYEMFSSLEDQLRPTVVSLKLPKFKVETAMTLNDVLMSLGIRKAFTNAAEFSQMTTSSVAVDEVRQKTYIDVSEKGTEAAAVTSIGVRLTSVRPDPPQPVRMVVDRPFVFAIRDSRTLDILFAGVIRNVK